MARKYQVTDSRGQVHTRKSDRTYTHAVISHRKEGSSAWRAKQTDANWAGSASLAEKQAAERRRSEYVESVEIIEVK
jgi:hypothetical protein